MFQAANKVKVTFELSFQALYSPPKTFFFFFFAKCLLRNVVSGSEELRGLLHLGVLQGFSFSLAPLPPTSPGDPSPTSGEIPP